MRAAAIVAAVCGVAAVAFLLLVYLRARRLAARASRLASDALEPRSSFPAVAVARAVHLRTLLGDSDACLPAFTAEAHGELAVTERELTFAGTTAFHVPLARVVEARFLPEFQGVGGDGRGVVVKVTWVRAGERLASVFFVQGRRVDAERLRKEIHLRAGMAPRPPMPEGMSP